jgi:hypothetical protein
VFLAVDTMAAMPLLQGTVAMAMALATVAMPLNQGMVDSILAEYLRVRANLPGRISSTLLFSLRWPRVSALQKHFPLDVDFDRCLTMSFFHFSFRQGNHQQHYKSPDPHSRSNTFTSSSSSITNLESTNSFVPETLGRHSACLQWFLDGVLFTLSQSLSYQFRL